MQIITSDLAGWTQEKGVITTAEGFQVPTEFNADLCRFRGVPATLALVDDKHKTNTTLEVVKAVSKKPIQQFILSDDEKIVSLIDPRSRFMEDDEINPVFDKFRSLGVEAQDPIHYEGGAGLRMVFNLDTCATDKFMDDLFKKQIVVDRLPEGGLSVAFNTLRLACSNGMMVADSKISKVFRKTILSEDQITEWTKDIMAFNLEEYFQKLWKVDGEFISASVEDYLKMRRTLQDIVDEDAADEQFPLEPIELHYASQGIEINEINGQLRSRIPAGLSYYDCFNFLTHGVKQAENLTLADKVKVGSFAAKGRLRQLAQTELNVHGQPRFSESQILRMRGDAA